MIRRGNTAVLPRLIIDPKTQGHISSSTDTTEFLNLGINSTHLELMKTAMNNVTTSPVGTAYKSRIKKTNRQFGGKTGTVQVRRISKAERESELGVRKNKDLAWSKRDHALFVGQQKEHDHV